MYVRSDRRSVANGLKVYQGFVLSSNKRHQSIRGSILRLKKFGNEGEGGGRTINLGVSTVTRVR